MVKRIGNGGDSGGGMQMGFGRSFASSTKGVCVRSSCPHTLVHTRSPTTTSTTDLVLTAFWLSCAEFISPLVVTLHDMCVVLALLFFRVGCCSQRHRRDPPPSPLVDRCHRTLAPSATAAAADTS